MMSQNDKLRGGPLAETEIQIMPSTSEDRVLSRLNKDFRLSKAQQILRLLKDQDDLNQRFRDCALLEDDGGGGGEGKSRRTDEQDEDNWSIHEENHSEGEDSDASENEAERRAARRVALRKHRNSIDPGRCKTSMGFYNEAEVTEIPYDTDSDNVPGLDSACSTPRGVSSGALSARQVPKHLHYGALGSCIGGGHGGMGIIGGAGSGAGAGGSVTSTNSRLRAFHIKMGEGGADPRAKDSFFPEECVVQSARSSRPKTSLASSASSRSRYYRQQPHPEAKSSKKALYNNHNNNTSHNNNNNGHHILQHYHAQQQLQSQQAHHPHHHHHHHHHHEQQQQGRAVVGMGDTRQAIISRLDPSHPMAVRPFCESKASASEEVLSPRPVSIQIQQQPSSQPSTPRGGGGGGAGEATTPRSGSRSGSQHFKHTEVTLFDMVPGLSKDSPGRSNNSRRAGGGSTPGGAPAGGAGGAGVARSMSFAEHPRMLPANRPLLSVDSSLLQAGDVSPRPGGGAENNRRQRPTRVKKRVGEMQSRGAVSTSMHVIGERAHPSMTVMKLPPLETSVSKGGGSSRDLVCVGKD